MPALQLAVLPLLTPWQVQFQGPLPVTAPALPVLQRLAVGMLVKNWPLLLPQPVDAVIDACDGLDGLKDGLLKDLGVTMDRKESVVDVFAAALKRYPRVTGNDGDTVFGAPD